jgi:hypothetical protein
MTASTTAYHRRLKRTSRTGLTRKAQKPGEKATAVRPAMDDSGTWRSPSNCGTAKAITPPQRP